MEFRTAKAILRGKKGSSPALFISALVTVIISLSLYNPLKAYVGNASEGDANASVLNLIPLVWVFGTLAVAVGLMIAGFRHK